MPNGIRSTHSFPHSWQNLVSLKFPKQTQCCQLQPMTGQSVWYRYGSSYNSFFWGCGCCVLELTETNSQCSQKQTPHQPNIPLCLFSGTLNYKGEQRCHSFSCHKKSRHSQIDQDNDDLVIVLARPAVRVLHDQAAEGGAVTGDLREGWMGLGSGLNKSFKFE